MFESRLFCLLTRDRGLVYKVPLFQTMSEKTFILQNA